MISSWSAAFRTQWAQLRLFTSLFSLRTLWTHQQSEERYLEKHQYQLQFQYSLGDGQGFMHP